MKEMMLHQEELAENPTTRVPVGLCLDTSGSMDGEPIQELNEGVRILCEEIRNDLIANPSVEICIVTFGNQAMKMSDFCRLHEKPENIPLLTASGMTPMGAGVDMSLDLCERRKNEYAANGVDYYQPWLVLMTDGFPTDNIEVAVSRTNQLVLNGKLTVFPIGFGPTADLNTLARFSPKRQPMRLKDGKMKDFFEWLSKSIQVVSRSNPSQNPNLPGGVGGWGQLI